jgi:hypothetical protein
MRWIAEPNEDLRELAGPLLTFLSGCPGGWPGERRDDWFGWRCVKHGPQAFVFERADGDRNLYLKWLPRIILTKRRRGLAFWPTPAQQHADWTVRIRGLGVDVVELHGAGCLVRSPLDLRQPPSFVLTSSPVGARTLRDALLDDDLTDEQRERIGEIVAGIASKLHAARIRRVDLRPANLLIDADASHVLLFDFDSFRYDRTRSAGALARHRAKDMEKVERTRRFLLRQESPPAKWKAQRSRNTSVSQT